MRIRSTRRRMLVAGGMIVTPRVPRAQAAPQIRLLVPFAAGGPMDMVARLVAPGAAQRLGQTIVVENRSGGTGAVTMAEVARARPDGTTLMITGSSWPVVMLLNRNLSFRVADFAPLTRMTLAPHLFVVPAGLPVRSVEEFVAQARRRPGAWSYGTSGIGTTLHLGTEMLKMRTGIDIVHVPYRGNAPAMADLLAGRLQTIAAADGPTLAGAGNTGRRLHRAGLSSEPIAAAPLRQCRPPSWRRSRRGGQSRIRGDRGAAKAEQQAPVEIGPQGTANGHDLKRIPALFNFEAFRPELERAAPRSDGSKGGRRLSITC